MKYCKLFHCPVYVILSLGVLLNLAFIFVYMYPLHYNRPKTSNVTPAEVQRDVMEPDGYIRNCVTGGIFGKVLRDVESKSIYDINVTVQDHEHRKQIFKEIFDKRIWGTEKDADFKGPIASGIILFDYYAMSNSSLSLSCFTRKLILLLYNRICRNNKSIKRSYQRQHYWDSVLFIILVG